MIAALARRPRVVVAVAFAVTAGYLAIRASQVDDYVWLIDELLYTKVAQGFANGELLRAEVYDVPAGLPNALYPRLLAPLHALLPSIDAFTATHVLNALLFASVIFPVYLLGRRLGAPLGLAVLGGLASAWVPWAVATTVVMTESLAYPAFMWACFAIAVALDSPSPRTHALALLAIGVASYARVQFALLLPIFVAAAVLQAAAADGARLPDDAGRGFGERLRRHASLGLMLAAIMAVLGILAVAGVNPLGIYQFAADRMRFPPGWLESSSWHLAHVVVGLGIVPALAWLAWLKRAGTSPRSSGELGFAIFSGLTVVGLAYLAGDFAQNVAGGQIQERYIFYVAPLLILGTVALLSDLRAPSPRLSLVAAAIPLAAILSIPDYNPSAGADGFAIVKAAFTGFVRVIEGRTAGLRELGPGDGLTTAELLVLVTIVFALALPLLLRLRWRAVAAPAILAAVLVYGAVQEHYLLNRAIPAINGTWQGLAGEQGTPRDWVDQAAPGDGEVGIMRGDLSAPVGSNGREVLMRTQFWNERVQASYASFGRTPFTGFDSIPLEVDSGTGRVTTPTEADHMVVSATDPMFALRGEVVATAPNGLQLIAPEHPYRARWLAQGGDVAGLTTGTRPRTVTVFERGDVTLPITAPAEAGRPVPYLVEVDGRTLSGRLGPGETRELALGTAREISVRARRSTELADGRRVGLRVGAPRIR